ncbi:hypothetical protein [Amycolatopsis saalfeldensis]|uniref:Uncharacterized protein n=1 Tax=Amycolatopsis saalfeldensis TaxID=394193 RepID=A0A1H8WZB3_9PSEU|nr:hypothetical protein [Amycolatopsis saalfeldensis]SEP32956.1 hypothetical protein SAMN04489732_10687 [Amycolatopsis saalfeldensis]
MSRPTPAQDAWKTPEIREAESALDRTTRKSQDLVKDLEKIRLKPVQRPDTPERIEALKTAASKPDAPAELRLVKRKVDAGEFKWEDVASGRAFADPEVRALASAKLGESKDIYEELEEGLTPEEVLEARAGSRNDLADSGRSAYPAAPETPAGFSNENPLASSADSYQAPPPAEHHAAPEPEHGRHAAPPQHAAPQPKPVPQDEEFTNPLGDRGYSAPSASPEPDQSRHATAPQRPEAPRFTAPEEDEFADPLGDRDSKPPRQDPPARRPRREDRGGDDDDYFGNSLLS